MSFGYVWLVPVLPLLAGVLTPLLRKSLGRSAHWPAVLAAGGALLASLAVLLGGLGVKDWSAVQHVVLAEDWISLGSFRTSLSLLVDPLTAVMLVTITSVGLGVVVFSTEYMSEEDDAEYASFFAYVSLFLAAMSVLVLADNFLLMFVGWEGVGLCSYLLIGFWYRKPEAADAAQKAFVINRIGDVGLIFGVLLIWTSFGTLDYGSVFAKARDVGSWGPELSYGILAAICMLLFWGCTGKSAQLPLYTWLPDAMEGPTPVSALIHAATMVTAGVYLVARCSPLFFPGTDGAWPADWSITPPDVVAVVGGASALFAATIALRQYDMKRILAYSTMSQLGYMFLALGVGAGGAGIYHLHTHAFFKAALFLSAGVVMHATHGVIDIRKIGGLRGQLGTTFLVFVVASAALAGFPLTAGFFSKDSILHEAFARDGLLGTLALLTAVVTAFYTFRLVFCAFLGREKLPAELDGHVHAPGMAMTAPIVVLGVMSIGAGLYGIGAECGLFGKFLGGTPLFSHDAGRVLNGPVAHAHGGLPTFAVILLSSAAAAAGIWFAWKVYVEWRMGAEAWPADQKGVATVLENKYWVDEAYDGAVARPLQQAASALPATDRIAVEGGSTAVGILPQIVGWLIRPLQSGYLQSYALYMALGVGAVLVWWLRKLV